MDQYLSELRENLSLRDLQPATCNNYLRAVRSFLLYLRRPPEEATTADARAFLLGLRGWGRSTSTINVHHAALVFWFGTLGRPEVMADVPRCKHRRHGRMPDVPTVNQVARLFEATAEPFYRTLFQTIYATGMRSREVRNLRTQHIRSEQGVIHVPAEYGKGRKERVVPLGTTLLGILRAHWKRGGLPGPLLFPARAWYANFPDPTRRPWKDHPVSDASANTALHRAQVAARIDKRITLHTLRHAFATHLLEQGVEMRRLQLLLGHASIQSTQFYTHLRTDILRKVPSPLDLLPK